VVKMKNCLAVIISIAIVLGLVGVGYLPMTIISSADTTEWALDYTTVADPPAAQPGDYWFKYSDKTLNYEVDSTVELYGTMPSMHITTSGTPSDWLVVFKANAAGTKIDLDNYAGMKLQAAIKGAAGGEEFQIGFRNGDPHAREAVTATTSWTTVTIPIDSLLGTLENNEADGFIMVGTGDKEVWVADVKIVSEDDTPLEIYTDPNPELPWALVFNDGDTMAGALNSDGSALEKAATGLLPIDAGETYKGLPSIRLNLTNNAAWWFATVTEPAPMDITAYADGYELQFALKGETGGEEFKIGFKQSSNNAGVTATATTAWQVVKIPMANIIAANPSADLTISDGLVIYGENGTSFKAWLSDVKIVNVAASTMVKIYTDPNPELPWALVFNDSTATIGALASDGGALEKSAAGLLPMDAGELYKGLPSLRLNLTNNAAWWFATVTNSKPLDVTKYADGYDLQFAIKGAKGSEQIKIGFKNASSNAGVTVSATNEWKDVRVSISSIIGANSEADLKAADGFVIFGENGTPFKVWLSDVKIVPQTGEKTLWSLLYDENTPSGAGLLSSSKGTIEKWDVNGLFPLDSNHKYNDKPSMRLNVTGNEEWWIGMINTNIDLTQYKSNYLQFAVKGEKGGEQFRIGFKKNDSNAGMAVTATANWTVVTISIADLLKEYPDFDAARADGFVLYNMNGDPLKFWFADVKIVEKANPNTGDDFTPVIMVALFMAATLCVAVTFKKRKTDHN